MVSTLCIVGVRLRVEQKRACEDRVLDGPASGEKGSKVWRYKYCNPRTRMNYHRLEAVSWLPWLSRRVPCAFELTKPTLILVTWVE